MSKRDFKVHMGAAVGTTLMLCLAGTTLVGCSAEQTLNQGYVLDQDALKLVPVGSSREQVLLTLGTPSTKATFGNEVFYYISQKRQRSMAFMKPRVVSRSVLAVYFDKDGTVTRIADYTLKDGHAFDMISRTTPTGGKEQTFLGQVLTGNSSLPQIGGNQTPGQI